MTAKPPLKTISVRATAEDLILFRQAAEAEGSSISAWIRTALRKAALGQIYGKGNDFPDSPGEAALLRAVLVILQTVGADTSEETKHLYAERAARQIEKIKAGK
ncbi:MAG: hypothetical protein HQL36_09815 [Alphaproteobacteria bacterium]|nr:hypothetical protein [Alphaproteobacteria bacterium]